MFCAAVAARKDGFAQTLTVGWACWRPLPGGYYYTLYLRAVCLPPSHAVVSLPPAAAEQEDACACRLPACLPYLLFLPTPALEEAALHTYTPTQWWAAFSADLSRGGLPLLYYRAALRAAALPRWNIAFSTRAAWTLRCSVTSAPASSWARGCHPLPPVMFWASALQRRWRGGIRLHARRRGGGSISLRQPRRRKAGRVHAHSSFSTALGSCASPPELARGEERCCYASPPLVLGDMQHRVRHAAYAARKRRAHSPAGHSAAQPGGADVLAFWAFLPPGAILIGRAHGFLLWRVSCLQRRGRRGGSHLSLLTYPPTPPATHCTFLSLHTCCMPALPTLLLPRALPHGLVALTPLAALPAQAPRWRALRRAGIVAAAEHHGRRTCCSGVALRRKAALLSPRCLLLLLPGTICLGLTVLTFLPTRAILRAVRTMARVYKT